LIGNNHKPPVKEQSISFLAQRVGNQEHQSQTKRGKNFESKQKKSRFYNKKMEVVLTCLGMQVFPILYPMNSNPKSNAKPNAVFLLSNFQAAAAAGSPADGPDSDFP
jgi:hypothetical protein